MLRGSQELRDTCITDGTPLQEDKVSLTTLEALTSVIKRVFLQLGEGLTTAPQMRVAICEAIAVVSPATTNFKEHEMAITSAVDKRATMQSLLRRLSKKCKHHPS